MEETCRKVSQNLWEVVSQTYLESDRLQQQASRRGCTKQVNISSIVPLAKGLTNYTLPYAADDTCRLLDSTDDASNQQLHTSRDKDVLHGCYTVGDSW